MLYIVYNENTISESTLTALRNTIDSKAARIFGSANDFERLAIKTSSELNDVLFEEIKKYVPSVSDIGILTALSATEFASLEYPYQSGPLQGTINEYIILRTEPIESKIDTMLKELVVLLNTKNGTTTTPATTTTNGVYNVKNSFEITPFSLGIVVLFGLGAYSLYLRMTEKPKKVKGTPKKRKK